MNNLIRMDAIKELEIQCSGQVSVNEYDNLKLISYVREKDNLLDISDTNYFYIDDNTYLSNLMVIRCNKIIEAIKALHSLQSTMHNYINTSITRSDEARSNMMSNIRNSVTIPDILDGVYSRDMNMVAYGGNNEYDIEYNYTVNPRYDTIDISEESGIILKNDTVIKEYNNIFAAQYSIRLENKYRIKSDIYMTILFGNEFIAKGMLNDTGYIKEYDVDNRISKYFRIKEYLSLFSDKYNKKPENINSVYELPLYKLYENYINSNEEAMIEFSKLFYMVCIYSIPIEYRFEDIKIDTFYYFDIILDPSEYNIDTSLLDPMCKTIEFIIKYTIGKYYSKFIPMIVSDIPTGCITLLNSINVIKNYKSQWIIFDKIGTDIDNKILSVVDKSNITNLI